ncbi:MAG: hypothetical protein HN348_20675 [Proteobacteria bacterium]|jgi:hypothetical protein|nr:hypothetical protein [Pseudomonadota bacterium]
MGRRSVQLPNTLRDNLQDELEIFLQASSPSPETIATYLIENLEIWADEVGVEDVIGLLEESGALEITLQDNLESEMSSNDEFESTAEEVLSLFESLCEVDWVDSDDFETALIDEEELDDEEELVEEEEDLK